LTKPLLLQGDAVEVVKTLDDDSIQTVVTSPPYWALRNYGDDKQFGAEPTVEEYAANLVRLFGGLGIGKKGDRNRIIRRISQVSNGIYIPQ